MFTIRIDHVPDHCYHGETTILHMQRLHSTRGYREDCLSIELPDEPNLPTIFDPSHVVAARIVAGMTA